MICLPYCVFWKTHLLSEISDSMAAFDVRMVCYHVGIIQYSANILMHLLISKIMMDFDFVILCFTLYN